MLSAKHSLVPRGRACKAICSPVGAGSAAVDLALQLLLQIAVLAAVVMGLALCGLRGFFRRRPESGTLAALGNITLWLRSHLANAVVFCVQRTPVLRRIEIAIIQSA